MVRNTFQTRSRKKNEKSQRSRFCAPSNFRLVRDNSLSRRFRWGRSLTSANFSRMSGNRSDSNGMIDFSNSGPPDVVSFCSIPNPTDSLLMEKLQVLKVFFPLLLFLTVSCYSVEFFPEPDYPNLRKNDVEGVLITRTRPERPIQILGKLVFRGFAGDLRDAGFLRKVRQEAAERGAEGAWITSRSIRRQSAFETTSVNPRMKTRQPTGRIQSRVSIVKIILFNYASRPEGYFRPHREKP